MAGPPSSSKPSRAAPQAASSAATAPSRALPSPFPSSSSSSLDLDLLSHGWSLSFDDLGNPSLFHPFSASTIGLPPLITPPSESESESESDSYIPFTITLVDRVSGITVQIPPSVPRRRGSFTVSPPPQLRRLHPRFRIFLRPNLPAPLVGFQLGRAGAPQRSGRRRRNNPKTDCVYPREALPSLCVGGSCSHYPSYYHLL